MSDVSTVCICEKILWLFVNLLVLVDDLRNAEIFAGCVLTTWLFYQSVSHQTQDFLPDVNRFIIF